ncbi:MAG TPA: hypothetical protein VG347_16125 [Verrucomicrobiae bacterium]|nr:hypothetical protein [Verrucomicrobiae bacterium]
MGLAICILTLGVAVFCAVHISVAEARQELAVQNAAWQAQTQQLAQLTLVKQQVLERIDDNKRSLAALPPLPVLQQLEQKVLSGDSLKNLSAAESEQLLAELGFNWNTTGDYLIISKKSLDGISYYAMRGAKLSKAARETLAITATEQGAIESMTGQLIRNRTDWAKANVQRNEPSGDVVADYSLPVDLAYSKSQFNVYTNEIVNTLGEQRAQWLKDHSEDWMQSAGLFAAPDMSRLPKEVFASLPADAYAPAPMTMKLERYQSGDQWRLNVTTTINGGTMTTSVSPGQPFPEAFRGIFPGGWQDLAAQEGFELPAEFNKKK